jgi:hypothetical protein
MFMPLAQYNILINYSIVLIYSDSIMIQTLDNVGKVISVIIKLLNRRMDVEENMCKR